MKVLAVDTTSERLSVVLSVDGRAWKRAAKVDGGHDDRLFPEVERLLRSAKLGFKDLDALVVASGPGSFTGIRVGITFVSVLAKSLERPAVGVSLLEAEAFRAARTGSVGGATLGVVFPARRGELFFQPFRAAGDGQSARALEKPAWLMPGEFAETARRFAAAGAFALSGPAAREGIRALGRGAAVVKVLPNSPIDASHLIPPALERLEEPPAELSPLYLKPAYYERTSN